MRMGAKRARAVGCLLSMSLVVAACGGSPEEETEATAESPTEATGDEEAEATGEAPSEEAVEEAVEEEGSIEAPENWEPEYVDGVLQPLPDGFPDREIMVINRRQPGHRDYEHMTSLLESVGDNAPVELVVEDRTGLQWKTWTVVDILLSEEQCHDGYCISPLDIPGGIGDLAVDPIERELGYGLDDFQPIAAVETHPFIVAQRSDAPWGDTFEDFVAYAQENPGEVLYASNETGSGHDIFAHHVFNTFGIEVQKAPMPTQQEAGTALGAGAADITVLGFPILPLVEAGRAETLLVTGPEGMDTSAYGENVPTHHDIEELAGQDWGVIVGWMVNKDTPDLHVQWLNELMSNVEDDEDFMAREDPLNIEIDVSTVEEAEQLAEQAFDLNQEIARELGLHWEQQG